MIANITTGSFLKPLFDYNQKKVKEGVAKTLLVGNVFDQSEQTAQNLMLSIANQSKRKDKFFHASLNFPVDDKVALSDTLMKQISKDYMAGMGFPENHPIVIYRHEDTEHPHLHIVTSKILANGRPLPDSHYKYKSQRITRELELKYELTKVKSNKLESSKTLEQGGLRNDVLRAIDNINKTFYPKDLKELNQYLNSIQLGMTVLPKEPGHSNNSEHNNLIFHRVNTNNRRLDKGIKSSSLGFDSTYNNLEQKINSTVENKAERSTIQKNVSGILYRYERLDIEKFKSLLMRKNIDLNYKYDSKNNLVGISYTSTITGNKYSGEKLGAKFKSRALKDKLTQGETILAPKELTRSSLEPLRKYLSKLDIGPAAQQLLYLGYNIHEENKKLYVSDFRNSKGEGYIPLRDLELPFNHNITKIHISSDDNYFKGISREEAFMKRREEFVENLGNVKGVSKSSNTNEANNISSLEGSIYAAQTTAEEYNPSEDIADIDKKKKQKRKRKI